LYYLAFNSLPAARPAAAKGVKGFADLFINNTRIWLSSLAGDNTCKGGHWVKEKKSSIPNLNYPNPDKYS
jgi:hypothetical protein